MKNLRCIFTVFLILLSISLNFYFYFRYINFKSKFSDIGKNYTEMYKYLDSITFENFERKVNLDNEFFVYIGRPDCDDCLFFEPMFKTIIKDYELNSKIIYLNVMHSREKLDDEEWKLFKEKYGFTQIPAIIHFKNGKNINMIEWDSNKGLSEKRLVNWLHNNLINK